MASNTFGKSKWCGGVERRQTKVEIIRNKNIKAITSGRRPKMKRDA